MASTFLDLVMDNGELVRIECPEKYVDELHESIEHCMKRGDWLSVHVNVVDIFVDVDTRKLAQFDGCSATYMGLRLDRIAMHRVVATL